MDKGELVLAVVDFTKLELGDAYLINYFSVKDKRGGFSKYFEKDCFNELGLDFRVSECFTSISSKNVIRGLHFQTNHPQAKIVSVIKGRVFDVMVDLRNNSPTYKKWIGCELNETNHKAFYIPRGFAHGFASLEDDTIVMYLCDGKYDSETDSGIRYDDPEIGIMWPILERDSIHSERDLGLRYLTDYNGCIFMDI